MTVRPWSPHWLCRFGFHSWRPVKTPRSKRPGIQCRRCYFTRWFA